MMAHVLKVAGLKGLFPMLKGLFPIMIDWSDWGVADCSLLLVSARKDCLLPLMSCVSVPAELNPPQNRLEEFVIRRLLSHMPDEVRPPDTRRQGMRTRKPYQVLTEHP
jgi:hypothetical protein